MTMNHKHPQEARWQRQLDNAEDILIKPKDPNLNKKEADRIEKMLLGAIAQAKRELDNLKIINL